ncbi:MAG: agmatine deiminase family protein [Bacteroidota bacterium]|nr:agmatine deiminase family protein [Candidatus Kapabacteria bacterium]MDW8220976.1 agmatine deiminase family protein [Bacteroidota bacterium]
MYYQTPAQQGYTMPAEWECHKATWLGWPLNANDWPGKFVPIRWVYGEIVRALTRHGELVRIVVDNQRHEEQARAVLRKVGIDVQNLEFFQSPMNRGWMRDCMPAFVNRTVETDAGAITEHAAIKFIFNGWAKYDNWQHDNALAYRLSPRTGWNIIEAHYKNSHIVLEGGGIDVNGKGTLLTTEECYLDTHIQVRNPGMDKTDFEQALKDNLGVTNILWLGKGIVGDDTHGHVDDICRFINPTTVVLAQEDNPYDANYRILEENRERLEGMYLESGSKINVVPLPMPAPLTFNGVRLPASYANFYVGNHVVLVPTFNDPNDRKALGILAELFPHRIVLGIHAVDLVWGLGTLHCLTREEPA